MHLTDRPPLQNGHLKDSSFNSATSANTSAHDTNAHINTHDFELPISNGVHDHDNYLKDIQSNLEPNSSLPDSGEIGQSVPMLSSQSAPDEGFDHSAIKLNNSPPDLAPAVVQQPISELREETQPISSKQTAEITEHKPQQDLVHGPELANGLTFGESNTIAVEPEPQAEPSMPPTGEEPQQTPTVSFEPAATSSLIEDEAVDSAPVEELATVPTAELPHHPPVPLPEGAAPEAPVDPTPSPAMPAETEALARQTEDPSHDQVMRDAPTSQAKMTREREDDDLEDGPAAKRSRTDENVSPASDFKIPERPAIDTQLNGYRTEGTQPAAAPMTQPQHKYILKVLSNVKRIHSATAFRAPVDFVALNIPSYPTTITKPMDLKTLEENLKSNLYPTVEAFVADFNQIVLNCHIFNGEAHDITKNADLMKASFDKHMEKLPGSEVLEPSPADRKKKAFAPLATKVAPPRRESRSSLPGTAGSPASASSPQTFALGPQGVPLIRRDSTVGDGRPKREIHPPAPRDLPYANQKPKKKKYQWELKFCEKVLNELSKPKYGSISYPFMAPVDPVALNIPTYHNIIKRPMDFGSMKSKLDHGEYENAKEFEADVRLVFQNCYRFNPQGDVINSAGHQFEEVFDREWSKKRDWVEANTPGSGPQSPGSSPEPDDSDDEDEAEDEEEEDQSELSKLQQQIAAMSRQVELITRKKKSPPVASKKNAKSAKPVQKHSKKTAAAPAKAEKKATSRPAKKEKTPYVTYEQKQDISNRINSLSESRMATALKIIRDNMPNLKVRHGSFYKRDILPISTKSRH